MIQRYLRAGLPLIVKCAPPAMPEGSELAAASRQMGPNLDLETRCYRSGPRDNRAAWARAAATSIRSAWLATRAPHVTGFRGRLAHHLCLNRSKMPALGVSPLPVSAGTALSRAPLPAKLHGQLIFRAIPVRSLPGSIETRFIWCHEVYY